MAQRHNHIYNDNIIDMDCRLFYYFYNSGLIILNESQYILFAESLEEGQDDRSAHKTTTTTSDERDWVASSTRCFYNRELSARERHGLTS